jgi:hypothetical protein
MTDSVDLERVVVVVVVVAFSGVLGAGVSGAREELLFMSIRIRRNWSRVGISKR